MSTRREMLLLSGAGLLAMLPAHAAAFTIRSRGKNYTPLNHIRSRYSMTLTETPRNIQLANRWNKLGFESAGRRCEVNDILVWLSHPLRRIGSQWALEDPDFTRTVDPSLRPHAYLKRVRSRVVVLDPGHGGKDSGAISPRRVHEKLLVMDISRRVRNHLQARGIQVELTRDSDRDMSLQERCRRAAALKADLFVSIHANSAGSNRTARGSETFVLSLPGCYSTNSYGSGTPSTTSHPGNRFDAANAALGFRIQQNLIRTAGLPDRGVKRARFEVLRGAPCPAALVETAFLSNPSDEAMMIDPSGRERLARGISNGITAYIADVASA